MHLRSRHRSLQMRRHQPVLTGLLPCSTPPTRPPHGNDLRLWNANQRASVAYDSLFKHNAQTHRGGGRQGPRRHELQPTSSSSQHGLSLTIYSSHVGLPVPPRPPALLHLKLHTGRNAHLHTLPYSLLKASSSCSLGSDFSSEKPSCPCLQNELPSLFCSTQFPLRRPARLFLSCSSSCLPHRYVDICL